MIDELNNILKKGDKSFRYVNHGGCGVMAAILAKNLSFLDIEIKATADADISLIRSKLNRNSVSEWNAQGVWFQHIWVEFTHGIRYAADISGAVPVNLYPDASCWSCKGSFTVEEMEELTATQAGWNPTFDRKQIPDMQVFFKQHLTKLRRQYDY